MQINLLPVDDLKGMRPYKIFGVVSVCLIIVAWMYYKVQRDALPKKTEQTVQYSPSVIKKPHRKMAIRPLIVGPDRQHITVNFNDVSVRTVLQLLSGAVGVNIVISDSVVGNISLHMKNVRWEEAVDVILHSHDLDKRYVGDILLIDKASNTNDHQKFEVLRTAFIQINYAKAQQLAGLIRDKSNGLLSERGALSVDERTNTLWLQDTADHLRKIEHLLARWDVPATQVMIEARIVYMSKGSARDLGVRFGLSKTAAVSDHAHLDLPAVPLNGTPAALGIALVNFGNGHSLDVELSALESEGKAEIMASPRLMTTNQRSATIESGEDIPYQETNVNGGTSVAFRKAVLRLKVTPQITTDGRLLMDLMINQDSDSGRRVQGVPVVLTKAIKTNVLIKNGQTIVLGGIYKQNKNRATALVPIFGSMPIVGPLFRRREARKENEELLIFITPKIIGGIDRGVLD